MKYKVTALIYELVEADSEADAKQKFKDNFEYQDIRYATYKIEEVYDAQS